MKWAEHGACAGKSELFFEDNRPSVVRKAKLICRDCTVQRECLDYAMDNNEFGLWGGMTANERRVRRALNKQGVEVA